MSFIPKGLYQLDYESKYNARYKFIPSEDGSVEPYEQMFCNRFIFNPHSVEEHRSELKERREKWEQDLEEMYGRGSHFVLEVDVNGNIERSKRRAKNKLFDYVLCNDFKCFVTLTLSAEKIERTDYKQIIRKFSTWLDNRVRRKGLVYVGVPEFHKDGAIHFHVLCNDVLDKVDSGTVIRPCGGRPVRVATAKKQGYKLTECKTVYNLPEWSLGFSTMYHTYGDIRAVANYVVKYITKGDSKVGGRWYYSGGALKKPIYLYDRVSFNDVDDYDFDFDCDGGKFKVIRK